MVFVEVHTRRFSDAVDGRKVGRTLARLDLPSSTSVQLDAYILDQTGLIFA